MKNPEPQEVASFTEKEMRALLENIITYVKGTQTVDEVLNLIKNNKQHEIEPDIINTFNKKIFQIANKKYYE